MKKKKVFLLGVVVGIAAISFLRLLRKNDEECSYSDDDCDEFIDEEFEKELDDEYEKQVSRCCNKKSE